MSKPESIRKIKERFIERENITDNAVVKEIQSANLLIDVQSHWYSDPNHNSGAIVFCPHRTGTIGVIDKTKQGILSRIKNNMCCDVSSFIGGDSTVSQDDFINNKTGIMVATKAFGMGIDKQNIGFTVNVNHSGSPEAFVQEAGRAGRDRKMALAVILYSGVTQKGDDCTVDFDIHKFFYNNNFLGKETEKIILYYIMEYMTVWHNDISDSFEDKPGKVTQGLLRTIDMIPDNKEEIFYISYTLLNDFNNINNFIASCNSERENNIKPLTIDNYYNAISKAIYRMCLIGVIKDFTQDYTNKLFRLVVKKLPKNMYYNQLANLLTRYYGKDRAYNEAEKAKGFKGNNEIQRCLGFLTDFIYNKIAGKRWQAILDIEELCRIATENSDWLEANEQIKDHLYYYFNSKFARNQYVAPNGENFSLTEDTDRGRISSFAIVKKYLRVIDDEICADGSPKDNIKHLHGAVRLIRRALMEPNPALNLLNIFCIYYLNPNPDERQQKDIENNYIQCVQTLYKSASCVDECTNELKLYLKELGSAGRGIVDDNTILMLENLMYAAIAYSHIQKCQIIFDKFLKI